MTWHDVATAAREITSRRSTCPYCGSSRTVTATNGVRVTVPTTECCPDALRRQIAARGAELNATRREMEQAEATVERIREEIDAATTNAARAQAEARLTRARGALARRISDTYTPRLRELGAELNRLKARLADQTRDHPEPPRGGSVD